MAINAKMNVDIGPFKSGIQQGTQILKGLNAEMKATDAEFKVTGNAEKKLEQQTKTLNSQMQVQKGIIDQAQKALKAMTDAGVDPADKAYQQMYATLMNAQAGLYSAQAAMNELGTGAQQAAAGADQLTESVNGIGKKLSMDQVLSGIEKITGGLEKAAQTAIRLGETIWNQIMDTAAWSDDTATLADRMGLSVEEVQKMQAVAGQFEAPVETMAKTWKKVAMNMSSDSADVQAAFQALGLAGVQMVDTGFGQVEQSWKKAGDYKDMFWEIGDALMNMSDAQVQSGERERLAQTLLGRGWDELAPLFKAGREEYEAALDAQSAASEEAIRNNAELNDSVARLEENFKILKAEALGQIAPAITQVTDHFSELLGTVTEYLKTDEGQQMLTNIGEALKSLMQGLTDLSAEDVVKGVKDALGTVESVFEWIEQNKGGIVSAIEAIGIAFGGLKLAELAINIAKVVGGFKDLLGLGSGGGNGGQPSTNTTTTTGTTTIPGVGNEVVMFDGMGSAGANGLAIGYVSGQIENHADLRSRLNMILKENGMESTDPRISNDYMRALMSNPTLDESSVAQIVSDFEQKVSALGPKVEVEPEVKDGSAESVAEQVGTVEIPAELVVVGISAGGVGGGVKSIVRGLESSGLITQILGRANGIWSVPYDGMLSVLHKGERVVPAREIASRNYSSNLYVESMYMNNGTDAAGLAAAMASAQRRTMSGYGS